MDERVLHTWQGIEVILRQWDDDQSRPDPWIAAFVAQAIHSVERGEPNMPALDMAAVPPVDRHAHSVDLGAAAQWTKAELRSAFEALPVPGGRPA